MARHAPQPTASPSVSSSVCKGYVQKYARRAVAVVASCAIVIGGGGVALVSVSGIANATHTPSIEFASSSSASSDAPASSEDFILSTAASRDMSAPIMQAKAEEEAARIAAEQAALKAEQEAISRAAQAQEKSANNGGVGVYEVDFSIGRTAFIEQWTARIDAYLAGSPLSGYGATFATAAWEAGIDPRWSPAISNTESSKGQNCFASHNAWGWTGASWSDWESAINAHIQGLAANYGFTISYSLAAKYCPPNTAHWYSATLSEMQKI